MACRAPPRTRQKPSCQPPNPIAVEVIPRDITFPIALTISGHNSSDSTLVLWTPANSTGTLLRRFICRSPWADPARGVGKMKDASAFNARLCCVRLPFKFWWEPGRPHAVLASTGEQQIEHAFLSLAFLGATQFIRLTFGAIKSGERNCWTQNPGRLARSTEM